MNAGVVQKIRDYQVIFGLLAAGAISIGFRVITPQTVADQTNRRFEQQDSTIARQAASDRARFEALEAAGQKRDAQLDILQREVRTLIRLECLDRIADQRSQVFLDCAAYLGGR